jgi:DNA polymerase
MIEVGIDFETYYDKSSKYSLTSMMTPEYILDPRFEVIGVSLSVAGSPAAWFSGDHAYLQSVFDAVDWSSARVTAHNANFDGAILEWIFKRKPASYFCTMMGARPYVAPFTGSCSLARVSEFFGIGSKGTEVVAANGKRRLDFSPHELARYGEYCNNDNALAMAVRDILQGYLPDDEQRLIDLTIRKFIRPRLVVDAEIISRRRDDLERKRSDMLTRAALIGGTQTILRSREKFAALLASYKVHVPMKESPTTGGQTYAFAKNDEGMADLLTHRDPRVRTLAEAKIFTSSTMETKRLERFQKLYDLDILGGRLLPIPLLYYGAHPGRFSGLDKINMQNLTRVKRNKLTKEIEAGHLRFALKAPKGYTIIAADLSNIEARLVATLAGCVMMREGFRNKVDLYCEFASRIYGRKITKLDEIERFVGKTCILGLGYGMGWRKFDTQMRIARVRLGQDAAYKIVWLYRNTYPEVPQLWSALESAALHMQRSDALYNFGPVTFVHERILLPNGMPITYPGLHRSSSGDGLSYNSARAGKVGVRSLWGGAITENICQALARIIITDAELKLASAGLRACLQVHDELVYCVPEIHAPRIMKAIEKVMTMPVSWLPELPIACEVKCGPTYGDAK